jgi:D-glycero-alpha-D-manno-heptose-7-phosphate kinase
MQIIARSACRVDLAGGTLDIWPLYLYLPGAVTVNFAVDRFTHCRITPRTDGGVVFISEDLKRTEAFTSMESMMAARKYSLALHAWAARHFAPRLKADQGFELWTKSEAPAGAGISGSSSLLITISSAFNKLAGTKYSIEKIREVAQNIEAQVIRVPTGAQDYYPAMYGGVSAIELGVAGIERKKLAVDLVDFEERVVLAYTGEPRNSGINNWEVTKAFIDGDKKVQRNFDRICAIAKGMRQAIESSDWTEAARLLREEWSFRRTNAPGISTPLIDRLVEVSRKQGAKGAKVCGAGGGGCVFFLVERGAKERVSQAIADEGATVLPVKVAKDGVRVQTRT